MHIYRCEIILHETTFFSSREVSNTYFTEPVIGNYALAYALDLVRAPYFNDGAIYYREHMKSLNDNGIYVTPGTIREKPRFMLGQFNAQADAYWYAFANNVIVTRPDGARAVKSGAAWYIYYPDGKRQKVGLENRPQHGTIRYLAIGNIAEAYVLSREPLVLSSYVRLGKFMSKARVNTQAVPVEIVREQDIHIPLLLNPVDIPDEYDLSIFDLVNIPPVPLVINARLSGQFYRLPDRKRIPVGMHFGVGDVE